MKDKQAEFDEKRDERTRDWWAHTPAVKELREKRRNALSSLTQQAVDVEVEAILQRPCGSCKKVVIIDRVRELEVVDIEYRSVAKVPVFKCSDPACTAERFSVPPVVAYCAPTSAGIFCRKWLTLPVVTLFSELNFNGVSGHGGFASLRHYLPQFELFIAFPFFFILFAAFAQALGALDQFMMPRGSVLVQSTTTSHSAPLKSEQVVAASQEQLKVVFEAAKLPVRGRDCFAECFVCSHTVREQLDDGASNEADFVHQTPDLTVHSFSPQERPSLANFQ